jgi:hypothetical protein
MVIEEPHGSRGPGAYLGEAIVVRQAAEVRDDGPSPGPAGNPHAAHTVPRIGVGKHAPQRLDSSRGPPGEQPPHRVGPQPVLAAGCEGPEVSARAAVDPHESLDGVGPDPLITVAQRLADGT